MNANIVVSAEEKEAMRLKENLKKAFAELAEFWSNAGDGDVEYLLSQRYPFKESFDELNLDVKQW